MKLYNFLLILLYPAFSIVSNQTGYRQATGSKTSPDTIRILHVGDTVPDIRFQEVFNYRHSKANLKDFKAKLIILDFWASYCSTCLEGIPVADSLQREFGKDVQFILVNSELTHDNLTKAKTAIGRINQGLSKKLCLPVAVNDTAAYRLFRFKIIPHYVWIGKDGVIKAITNNLEVTRANIRAMLSGQQVTLPVKGDRMK